MTFKTLAALIISACFFGSMAFADDAAPKKEGSHKAPAAKKEGSHKAAPKPAVAVSLVGTISVENGSRTVKKKDGTEAEVNYTRYWITLENGKKQPIAKPRKKKGDDAAAVIDLGAYDGKKVKVSGQGYVRHAGTDKEKSHVKVIESIEVVTD